MIVLKLVMVLLCVCFLCGICLLMFDVIVCVLMWVVGFDYGYGIGYGVGYFLNVYEGL